jgi:hypothetical protein
LHDTLTELLNNLKIAIHHSSANDRICAAMDGLDKAGHMVDIAVDIAVDFAVVSEGSEKESSAPQTPESAPGARPRILSVRRAFFSACFA